MSRTITTEDLARPMNDAARVPFVLDVRPQDPFQRWRIEGKAPLGLGRELVTRQDVDSP